MEVRGQNHGLDTSLLGETTLSTHCTKGWFSARGSVETLEKRKSEDSSLLWCYMQFKLPNTQCNIWKSKILNINSLEKSKSLPPAMKWTQISQMYSPYPDHYQHVSYKFIKQYTLCQALGTTGVNTSWLAAPPQYLLSIYIWHTQHLTRYGMNSNSICPHSLTYMCSLIKWQKQRLMTASKFHWTMSQDIVFATPVQTLWSANDEQNISCRHVSTCLGQHK